MSKQDFTATLDALAVRKAELDARKKAAKIEIAARVEAELATEIAEAEKVFATALKEAVIAGVPVTAIQREVLKTNAWGSWTKWRDMVGVPSIRDVVAAEKQAAVQAAKGYVYNPQTRVLTITKNDEDKGGYVFRAPWGFAIPLDTEEYRHALPSKEDWYELEAEKTYAQMWQTFERIFEELNEKGEL